MMPRPFPPSLFAHAVWAALCAAVPAAAAEPGRTGIRLSGTVRDSRTGAPIPDAEVTVDETRSQALTRDGGYFHLERLEPGRYTLSARVLGYKDASLRPLSVTRDTSVTLNLEPDPLAMDPVIVTGTRSDHLQSRVPLSTTVLTADWLGRQNGHNAGELIASAAGVWVKDGGGLAGIKTLSIRGSGDAQVLVLLDGQRLNAAQDGGVDLGAVPAESLERIEIVRGGHSSLLGADALGGAVHLVTRDAPRPDGFSFGAQSTAGSFATRGLGLHAAERLGPAELAVAYNRTESEGDFDYRSPLDGSVRRRENNDFTGRTLMVKAKAAWAGGGRLQILGHWGRSDRGSADPVTSSFPSSLARRGERYDLKGVLVEHQLAPTLRVEAQAYAHERRNDFRSLYENDRHDAAATGAEASVFWAVRESVLFSGAGELRRDDLESTKFLHCERETRSLMLQSEIGHGLRVGRCRWDWKWVPAARWDRAGGRNVFSPKLGVLVRPFPTVDLNLRASAGRSFRLPTFNDLYWPEVIWPGMGGVRGNASLRPETAGHADLGAMLRWRGRSLSTLSVTVFRSRVSDLIVWESDAEWVYSPRNVGRARLSGFEAEWTLRLPGDRARFSLAPSWTSARDVTDPDRVRTLVYRPAFCAEAAAGIRVMGFDVNAGLRHTGARFSQTDESRRLAAYTLIGVNVQHGWDVLGGRVHAKAEIHNLFDEPATAVEGYPLPGREWRLTLSVEG